MSDRINLEELNAKSRELDSNWLWNLIRKNNPLMYSFCWGASKPTEMSKYVLRFTVQGYLHKGYVYLNVNGKDLFDIHLTTKGGVITKIVNDVYIEDLVMTLDNNIENDKNIYK